MTTTTMMAMDHIVWAVRDLDAAAAEIEALGLALAPRAEHPAWMGTANRTAQFADRTYLELLEVDRPDAQERHDPTSGAFGFGGWAKDRLARLGDGPTMLAFKTDDAEAARAVFDAAGAQTFPTARFERRAQQPDGSVATLGFANAFALHPAAPEIALFACQHLHAPELFWRPERQAHANGAQGIARIEIEAADIDAAADALAAATGGARVAVDRVRLAGGLDMAFSVGDGAARLSGIALAAAEFEARHMLGGTISPVSAQNFSV